MTKLEDTSDDVVHVNLDVAGRGHGSGRFGWSGFESVMSQEKVLPDPGWTQIRTVLVTSSVSAMQSHGSGDAKAECGAAGATRDIQNLNPHKSIGEATVIETSKYAVWCAAVITSGATVSLTLISIFL